MGLFFWGESRANAQSDCDLDCVNEKINALSRRVMALEDRLASIRTTTATAAKTTKESFFRISGGSATGTDWVKIDGTDFWFDQSLYGNVAEVTWQGWVDNGTGSVRLFDATNNRAVDGSETSVSASGRASFYSTPLSIWRGQNQYYVQVKNVNAVVVTVSTPRLRIVTR